MSDAKEAAYKDWCNRTHRHSGGSTETWNAFNAGWEAAVKAQMAANIAVRRPELFGLEPRVITSRTTDPGTSHAAAREIKVKAGSQRAHMLQSFFLYDWMEGMTDEEAMERCPFTSPNSEYAKRCSELREAGLIEPTGETRPGASGMERIVSRITDRGRKAVEDL